MRQTTAAIALFGAALVIAPSGSFAQTALPGPTPAPAARPADPARPGQPAASTTRRDDRTDTRAPDAPVAGANSFTEGQARSRIEGAGYSDVSDLQKDDQGVWRGTAMRSGSRTDVALDYQGNVVAGAAARGTTTGSTSAAGGSTPARDGTPGNPPSTATGRAVDQMQGQAPRPDGTPGNPPGTAVGRAVGTTSGPDGTPANPPSTATGRAADRAQGQTPRPDGTPGNPPGTAAGRAVDRALGTNSTGANPSGAAPSR
jgi:hypothetical protein